MADIFETERSRKRMRGLSWEMLKASLFLTAGYGAADYAMRTHFNLEQRAPDAMEFLDVQTALGSGLVLLSLLAWRIARWSHESYLDKHFER